MKILSLDTSTSKASIAVMEGAEVLFEVSLETGRKRGEMVAPGVDELLKRAGIKPAGLDAYAVGLGPGSFTGLRSSLAFIKGLAAANPRPVAGVSSLHALALGAGAFAGAVLPVVDARKGEVFAAAFIMDGEGALKRVCDDVAVTPDRLPQLFPGPVLLLGDALLRYREDLEKAFADRAEIAAEDRWHPRASIIARLALPRLAKGESDPIDSLVPFYIRSSDAELKLGPRKKRFEV